MPKMPRIRLQLSARGVALGRILADMLEPALVDVLKQRIGDRVGVLRDEQAVEADRDDVDRLGADDRVAQ